MVKEDARFRRLSRCLMAATFLSWVQLNLAQTAGSPPGSRTQTAVLQKEEKRDYYQKWVDEDARYIITDEERSVFGGLKTEEEKEKFIEQFWARRDPNPTTAVNELKEEHYRRTAYANDHFESGLPGWKTDRGRIYIMYGPPDERETHAAGEPYLRPTHEGGGGTVTFPFEVWRYRYLEGVGPDVQLEFVDKAFSGLFRLTHDPFEKDALMNISATGETQLERLRVGTRADLVNSPYPTPALHPAGPRRIYDSAFERYETYSKVLSPATIRYRDLQQTVTVNVSYHDLPFQVRQDYFRLNEEQVLVSLTLEIENRNLTFKPGQEMETARVALYGLVRNLSNRVVQEFDDDLSASFQTRLLQQGLKSRSTYQKVFPLDRKMRYKLDLVIKDLHSGKMGIMRQALVPPHFGSERLTLSSLLLANQIRPLSEIPKENQMFVIGNVWVRPRVEREFPLDQPLRAYIHVYNAALDQSTLAPSLEIHYRVLRQGEVVAEEVDAQGESIQFYSERRIVLIGEIPTRELAPGNYTAEVEVRDRIRGETAAARSDLKFISGRQVQEAR